LKLKGERKGRVGARTVPERRERGGGELCEENGGQKKKRWPTHKRTKTSFEWEERVGTNVPIGPKIGRKGVL